MASRSKKLALIIQELLYTSELTKEDRDFVWACRKEACTFAEDAIAYNLTFEQLHRIFNLAKANKLLWEKGVEMNAEATEIPPMPLPLARTIEIPAPTVEIEVGQLDRDMIEVLGMRTEKPVPPEVIAFDNDITSLANDIFFKKLGPGAIVDAIKEVVMKYGRVPGNFKEESILGNSEARDACENMFVNIDNTNSIYFHVGGLIGFTYPQDCGWLTQRLNQFLEKRIEEEKSKLVHKMNKVQDEKAIPCSNVTGPQGAVSNTSDTKSQRPPQPFHIWQEGKAVLFEDINRKATFRLETSSADNAYTVVRELHAHIANLLVASNRHLSLCYLRAVNREGVGDMQLQSWQHAACLSIAEGAPGWEIDTHNDSAAMKAVRSLMHEEKKIRAEYGVLLSASRKYEEELKEANQWKILYNELKRHLKSREDAFKSRQHELFQQIENVKEDREKILNAIRDRAKTFLSGI